MHIWLRKDETSSSDSEGIICKEVFYCPGNSEAFTTGQRGRWPPGGGLIFICSSMLSSSCSNSSLWNTGGCRQVSLLQVPQKGFMFRAHLQLHLLPDVSGNLAAVARRLHAEDDLLQLWKQLVSATRQLVHLANGTGAALRSNSSNITPSRPTSSSSSCLIPHFRPHPKVIPSIGSTPEHEGATGRCGPPHPRGFQQVEDLQDLLDRNSKHGGWRSAPASGQRIQTGGGPGPGWGSTPPTLDDHNNS